MNRVAVSLHAVVVAVEYGEPLILRVAGADKRAEASSGLPFGPFEPEAHPTLESGLRSWVTQQTGLALGYVEQLYTFADSDRMSGFSRSQAQLVSIGYLALVRRPASAAERPAEEWTSWYVHFPWEDWRMGEPSILTNQILPALHTWLEQRAVDPPAATGLDAISRARMAFGCNFSGKSPLKINQWNEERVLERYELMYEAGLVDEAVMDGRVEKRATRSSTGVSMPYDDRRILATAIARLRGKLKYRPVVFELLAEQFSLTQLQQTVETLTGQIAHKQNFRRMVETGNLVEPTGARSSATGGRPAALFRFRRAIMQERPAPGLRIGSRG